MNCDYDLDAAIHDELFEALGTPRKHCVKLYEALGDLSLEELSSIQERVAAALLERRDIVHLVR